MAIAQTFLNSIDEGVFVTSIDLYFSAKDDTLPITIGLLEVKNDRSGSKILPFSAVTKAGCRYFYIYRRKHSYEIYIS